MKFLHSMIRVSDVEQSLDFYISKLAVILGQNNSSVKSTG